MAENYTQASYQCSQSRLFHLISHAFLAFKASIVLPCAMVVLHLGYRRWQQQRSSVTTNHTDVATYNAAVFDLIFIVGLLLLVCGEVFDLLHLKKVSYYVAAFTFPGPVLLHVLTCLERYLAVVHPITYLRLRRSGGSRIRNGILVCAWLLCFCWGTHGKAMIDYPFQPMFILFAIALVTVTLTSLRVLFALIRPKPGEGGRANQSRLRAFQTMAVITGTLWLWFHGVLITLVLSKDLSNVNRCLVVVSGYWFALPSHLVLPLLFLHRAGKLTCCKSATTNNAN